MQLLILRFVCSVSWLQFKQTCMHLNGALFEFKLTALSPAEIKYLDQTTKQILPGAQCMTGDC